MKETAIFLESKGFELETKEKVYSNDELERRSAVYRLSKSAKIVWELECLDIEPSPVFFLKLEEHHGLVSFSTPLDSWKFFDDRIEFKYQPSQGRHNALGLTYRF